jgi:hypothetical protein
VLPLGRALANPAGMVGVLEHDGLVTGLAYNRADRAMWPKERLLEYTDPFVAVRPAYVCRWESDFAAGRSTFCGESTFYAESLVRQSGFQHTGVAADGQVHPKPRLTELEVRHDYSRRTISLAADPWRDSERDARVRARRGSEEREVVPRGGTFIRSAILHHQCLSLTAIA